MTINRLVHGDAFRTSSQNAGPKLLKERCQRGLQTDTKATVPLEIEMKLHEKIINRFRVDDELLL